VTRTHIEVPVSIVMMLDKMLCAEYCDKLVKHLVVQRLGAKYHIYSNEHPPPHFHVSKSGDTASFDLMTGEMLKFSGNPRKLCQTVQREFPHLRPKLIQVWNDTRATDCTVGVIDLNALPKLND